jgi:hypothetical protein
MVANNVKKKTYILGICLFTLVFCILASPTFAQTEVKIESLNSSLFPFIYSHVSVKSNGISISDLTKDDFQVFENNNLQTEYFEVTPPETGGGVRLADIVFLIDVSGSMGPEIADVRNNVNNFADALAASNIDFRLGLVRFGNWSGANPYLFNNGNLTGDVSTFHGFVNTLYASGGYEPGFLAIQQAITGFNFRPGAQKIFLIITDEDSDAGNKQTTINMLLANSITLHAAARCNSGNSQSHYCNSTSVRAATGGLLFGVSSSYNTILDTIVEQASSTYVVRYKSSNPVIDQTVRNVEIFATADSETDSDTVSYIPGAAPEIELTPDTELLKTTPPECGYNLTISAVITDTSAPYVSSARLYYRSTSIILQFLGIFQSVNMANTFGDIWEADIPGNIVNSPGVEFYITATDGQTNSSLPKSDPSENPISIAVLPNELPQISHTPPNTGIAGQDLPIVADISDTTHNLESVKLFYRKLGEIQYTEVGFSTGLEQYQLNTVIPASVVTSYGVEYYIEAMDNLGAKSSKGTRDRPITFGVGFVWQRIDQEGEIYTIIIRSDEIPTNPSSVVYPLYSNSILTPSLPLSLDSYVAKAIAVLDSDGNRVYDNVVLRKILSSARNASLFRYLSKKTDDPLPLLNNEWLDDFDDISTTPQAKYCCIPFTEICAVNIGGSTSTDFGVDYPGILRFPKEYNDKNGVSELIDWELNWKNSLASLCPDAQIWDYIHPKGIKNITQRKKVYQELLKHLILQDGFDDLARESADTIVKLLNPLEIILRTQGATSAAEKILGIIDTIPNDNKVSALREAFKSASFTREEMIQISRGFAPNNFTGWGNKIVKIVGKAGEIMQWINLGLHIAEIPGEVLHFQLNMALMHAHGEAILEHTIGTLQAASQEDQALKEAIDEVSIAYSDETLKVFYEDLGWELAASAAKVTLDIFQIQLAAATVVATGTIVGAPAGLVLGAVYLSTKIIRGIVSYVWNKLEHEELQQAVVLISTLEKEWYNYPLKNNFLETDIDVPVDVNLIEKVNWNLSTRLYQALFVSSNIFEENSGLIDRIKSEVRDRRNKASKYRESLINIIIGKGDSYTTLGRLSGRPLLNGNHIGFVPNDELNHLIDLSTSTPANIFAIYGLKLLLYSPGEVGIIDPAGRKIGTFVHDDGTGNLVFRDFQEIPGASYLGGSSHPKEIIIPKPISGDYRIQLMGIGTGSYTLAMQKIINNQVSSQKESNGVFEPGKKEDGQIKVTRTELIVSQTPTPRSNIAGNLTDASTGCPIAGIRVSVGTKSAITDDNGTFLIKNIIPGEVNINAIADGYEPYSSGELTLISGETLNHNIQLNRIQTYYMDFDSDGYGDSNISIQSNMQPEGYVSNNLDCDDSRADIHPGAEEICDDGVDNNCDGLIDEDTMPPEIQLNFPQSNTAVQDGVIFTAEASDNCGIANVYFYVREPGGANGIPIGYEDLVATLNESTGAWEYGFDTTQLQDGYYVVIAKATDTKGNEGWSTPVPISIRNWAVIELLPNTANNKAGRTMPVKFALRIAAAVDPEQPFVYNEELEIRIYDASEPDTILQTSYGGDLSTDYRIDTAGELYITNFKTSKTPAEYVVEIWRMSKNFLIGSFTFETVK